MKSPQHHSKVKIAVRAMIAARTPAEEDCLRNVMIAGQPAQKRLGYDPLRFDFT
jgi:hypothetical protein